MQLNRSEQPKHTEHLFQNGSWRRNVREGARITAGPQQRLVVGGRDVVEQFLPNATCKADKLASNSPEFNCWIRSSSRCVRQSCLGADADAAHQEAPQYFAKERTGPMDHERSNMLAMLLSAMGIEIVLLIPLFQCTEWR